MEAEISSDGRTVWVNSPSGMCIGRFSRFGVDVHHDTDEQVAGVGHCLDCAHDLPPAEAWDRFKASMLEAHGVTVEDEHRPDFVPVTAGPKP